MNHDLKCEIQHFLAVASGIKKFEIRVNDRDFKVGDYLNLNAYDPSTHKFLNYTFTVQVTHMLVNFELVETVCLALTCGISAAVVVVVIIYLVEMI